MRYFTITLVVLCLFATIALPTSVSQETQVASGFAFTYGQETSDMDSGLILYANDGGSITFKGSRSEWSVTVGELRWPHSSSNQRECEGQVQSAGKLLFNQVTYGECEWADIHNYRDISSGVCVHDMYFDYYDQSNSWQYKTLRVHFYSFDQSGCNVKPVVV